LDWIRIRQKGGSGFLPIAKARGFRRHKFDDFTEIPFTSGTIQNINNQAIVEISTTDTDNTGLILYPHQKFKWVDATIYARAGWDVQGVKAAII